MEYQLPVVALSVTHPTSQPLTLHRIQDSVVVLRQHASPGSTLFLHLEWPCGDALVGAKFAFQCKLEHFPNHQEFFLAHITADGLLLGSQRLLPPVQISI